MTNYIYATEDYSALNDTSGYGNSTGSYSYDLNSTETSVNTTLNDTWVFFILHPLIYGSYYDNQGFNRE